jgi:LruC domain-containing protein
MMNNNKTRFLALLLGAAALALAPPARAAGADSDGDGVPDELDAFPCDPQATGVTYLPGISTHGLIMAEDQWPVQGDYDYNDAVVSYHYALVQKGNQVTRLELTYNVLAAGAGRAGGFGLTLPVPVSSVATMNIDSGGLPVPIANRAGETNIVLTLENNLFSTFTPSAPWVSPALVNTKPGTTVLSGKPKRLIITFKTPVTLAVADAPFDLFFFRTTDLSWETHLPEYAGTSLMNKALFKTGFDASTATRHFVGKNGMPYVLDLPASIQWPLEGVLITKGYPNFLVLGPNAVPGSPWWVPAVPQFLFTNTSGAGGTPPPAPKFINNAADCAIAADKSCISADKCLNVVCAAQDACHVPGVCNPGTGVCSNPVAANGAACSDGNGCTTGDTCQNGVCASGAPKVCSGQAQCRGVDVCNPTTGNCEAGAPLGDGGSCDNHTGNVCTYDTCQSGTCTSLPFPDFLGISCGNGICSVGGHCSGGVCNGAHPLVCAGGGGDSCTLAPVCDPVLGCAGGPVVLADGASCATGSAGLCGNGTGTCSSGHCQATITVACVSDPCVTRSCDANTGQCTETPNFQACESPPPCHTAEGATCDPVLGCSYPIAQNGSSCSDFNDCTQGDSCQAGACAPGAPVVCPPENACQFAATCAPNGGCSAAPKPTGSPCDDGNPCTQTDACFAGQCVGASPKVCAPLDGCHDAGVCSPQTGLCDNPIKANGSVCDDGNACTQVSSCTAGTCVGSQPVVCGASACHGAGACDPVTGCAGNSPAPDGTACDTGLVCSAVCQSGNCTMTAPPAKTTVLPATGPISFAPTALAITGVDVTSDRMLVTVDQDPNVYRIDDHGNISVFATLPTPYGETYLATSPGLGGFVAGDVYVSRDHQIYRIDGAGNVSLFTTLPNYAPGQTEDVSITFDTVGTFNYDMIITHGVVGHIWHANAASGLYPGLSGFLAFGGYGHDAEGPVVAPLSFGPYGGCLLWAVRTDNGGTVYAQCPGWPQNGKQPAFFVPTAESVHVVPQTLCTYGNSGGAFFSSGGSLDPANPSGIYAYPPEVFQGHEGALVVTSEFVSYAGPDVPSFTFIEWKPNQGYVQTPMFLGALNNTEGSSFAKCEVPSVCQ